VLYPVLLVITIIMFRGSMRFNLNPQANEIAAAELPFDIWLEFERQKIWLARDGFKYVCDIEMPSIAKMKNDKISMELLIRILINPETGVSAGIVSARSSVDGKQIESHDYVTFSSDVGNGGFYETSNLSMPDPYPFLDGIIKHQLPQIYSPRILHQLHLMIIRSKFDINALEKYEVEDKDKIIGKVVGHTQHEIALYVDYGFAKDDGDGFASLTPKGLLLSAHRNAGVGKILFRKRVHQRYRDSIEKMGIDLNSFVPDMGEPPVRCIPIGQRYNSLRALAKLVLPLANAGENFHLYSLRIRARVQGIKCQILDYHFEFHANTVCDRNVKMDEISIYVYDNKKQQLQEMAGGVNEVLSDDQEMEAAKASMGEKEYAEFKQEIDDALKADEEYLAEIAAQREESEDEEDYEEEPDEELDEEDIYQHINLSDDMKEMNELMPAILQLMKHYNADVAQEVDIALLAEDEALVWSGNFQASHKMVYFELDARTLERLSCESHDTSGFPTTELPQTMKKMMNRISRQLDDMDD